MGDRHILQLTSIESYTKDECISPDGIDTQSPGLRIGEFDTQSPNFLLSNHFPPLYNQRLERHSSLQDSHREQFSWPSATGPTVLSPWHFSGTNVQVTPGGNSGDEFGGLGFDHQIWANGLRPGRVCFTCQDSFRRTNLSFNQGNERHVQLCNPYISCTTSDGQSLRVSPQQLEFIPALESSRFQQIYTEQGSKTKFIESKKWPCKHEGCNKRYGRPQDVKRHVREKHAIILPICLICGIEWTRAEKIRRHLIKEHRDHFTKKERQQIRHLQGLNNTIDFLNEWQTTRLQ